LLEIVIFELQNILNMKYGKSKDMKVAVKKTSTPKEKSVMVKMSKPAQSKKKSC